MKKYDYIIIGGGLAGLGFSNNVENALIVEKNNTLGGHAGSFEFKGFWFDFGAHICHSKDEDWLASLNLKTCVDHPVSDVSNYDGGSWVGYPVQNNLKDITVEQRENAYKEINTNLVNLKPDFTSYFTWSNSVYGATLTERYYRRFTDKYWRTPMEDMNADWLAGRVMPINKKLVEGGMLGKVKSQAVFNSYRYPRTGGFQEFFRPLTETDNHVILNQSVTEIDLQLRTVKLTSGDVYEYTRLVNTVPLTEIVKMIIGVPSYVTAAASHLKYLNLIVTAVVLPDVEADKFPDWFYIYDNDITVSRVTNISKVSASSTKGVALQLETFRRNDETYDLKEVHMDILAGVKKLIGRDVLSSEITHKFVQYSYVVPCLDTEANRIDILNFLSDKGVLSCGLYGLWNYVWSDKAYKTGVELAKKQEANI